MSYAGILGMVLYFALILPLFGLYIYVLVLLIKFLRRGIKACDKYLSEDKNNNDNLNSF
ncbi:hypothetical protein [Vallitalea okinawensis]|uniref:hypothetical protein n=1 Tax=Vallitalea okinawensis TaxID=2078660 RepID=UPI001478267E|nr:hypothetical protein [Vallitalea okinawensis]